MFNINMIKELKQTCAKLINAPVEDIILTTNATHGINIFANGIFLDKDDKNVSFIDSEFPAVVYPWLNQELLGRANVLTIPSVKGYANETVIKKALIDYKIRVFNLSYVQFLGYRYNVRSIADFCRKHGIYLVVDAIQATGICPIDVDKEGIDYLCTGNQKWLMSPAGMGFTYISRRYRDSIHPIFMGTTSVNYDFDNFLDYKLDFKTDGTAYENSTPNTLGMIGMNESIKWFMALGVQNIYNHIIEIQDKFIEQLDKTKYKIESDLNPEHRSNILIFSHVETLRNKEIQLKLGENGIHIALREGFLRVSPHIYNNFEDVKILTDALNLL
jgi:selenocysteine lyase/cysteine desulfurase